jgi:hypothetical protein
VVTLREKRVFNFPPLDRTRPFRTEHWEVVFIEVVIVLWPLAIEHDQTLVVYRSSVDKRAWLKSQSSLHGDDLTPFWLYSDSIGIESDCHPRLPANGKRSEHTHVRNLAEATPEAYQRPHQRTHIYILYIPVSIYIYIWSNTRSISTTTSEDIYIYIYVYIYINTL